LIIDEDKQVEYLESEILAESKTTTSFWVQQAGTDPGKSLGISVDTNGDIIITGYFENIAKFGKTMLTSKGNKDIFVAKLNSRGQWIWAKRAGSRGRDEGCDVSVDSQGNIFLTGMISADADFGTTTLKQKGRWDISVAKLDGRGNWLWAKRAGGSWGADHPHRGETDKQGNFVITGLVSGTADFGSIQITAKAREDIFVAKIDSQGNWLWAKRAGKANQDSYGFGIAVDGQNNVFISGMCGAKSSFGTNKLTSKGEWNIFVAKLDTNGKWLWAQGATTNLEYQHRFDLSVDKQGNSVLTGPFEQQATFGKFQLTTKSSRNIFIAKLDSQGNWLWAKRVGSPGGKKCDAVAIDKDGNIFLTGLFVGATDFGRFKVSSKGGLELFVAKLSSGGHWLWVKHTDSQKGSIDSFGITTNENQDVFAVGYFDGTVDFRGTKLSAKWMNVFVWKLPGD